MNEIKVKVKAFLSRFFRNHELEDNENIFELGFVNSLFAMQLIMFIEKEFDIRVDNKDLDITNFSSVQSIVSFIESRI